MEDFLDQNNNNNRNALPKIAIFNSEPDSCSFFADCFSVHDRLAQAEGVASVLPGPQLSIKTQPRRSSDAWSLGCHPKLTAGPRPGSADLNKLLPLSGLQFLICGKRGDGTCPSLTCTSACVCLPGATGVWPREAPATGAKSISCPAQHTNTSLLSKGPRLSQVHLVWTTCPSSKSLSIRAPS